MSEKSNTKPAKASTKTAKKDAKTAKPSARPAKPAAESALEQETQPAPAPLETESVKDAPLLETAGAPLGTLSASEETESSGPVKVEAAEKPEPLRLPKGAFLALRKSGGIKFTSRAVVIYPDGRVAYNERGVPQKEYTRLRRAFNDGQMLSLRKLLDQINFWKTESAGQQNPDAFAYEIAARLGQRANEVQVFDGSVPENLKPLLERLVPLLPRE